MNVADLTEWLRLHRDVGYLLVFAFSFAESVAFLSIAFPGTVLLIAAGFLAFNGAFSPTWLIVIAGLGAFLGDTLSFFVGRQSSSLFRWVRIRPALLQKGREFIQKHGLWAVIFGKFIGPLRCVVPLLAGMFRMNVLLFFILESLSAPLWAVSLTFTGYFFYQSYSAFQAYLGLSSIFGILSAAFIGVVAFWIGHRRRKKKAPHQSIPL